MGSLTLSVGRSLHEHVFKTIPRETLQTRSTRGVLYFLLAEPFLTDGLPPPLHDDPANANFCTVDPFLFDNVIRRIRTIDRR